MIARGEQYGQLAEQTRHAEYVGVHGGADQVGAVNLLFHQVADTGVQFIHAQNNDEGMVQTAIGIDGFGHGLKIGCKLLTPLGTVAEEVELVVLLREVSGQQCLTPS